MRPLFSCSFLSVWLPSVAFDIVVTCLIAVDVIPLLKLMLNADVDACTTVTEARGYVHVIAFVFRPHCCFHGCPCPSALRGVTAESRSSCSLSWMFSTPSILVSDALM